MDDLTFYRLEYFCTSDMADYKMVQKLAPDSKKLSVDEFNDFCRDAIDDHEWTDADIKKYIKKCQESGNIDNMVYMSMHLLLDYVECDKIESIHWLLFNNNENMLDKLIDYGKSIENTSYVMKELLSHKAKYIELDNLEEEFTNLLDETDKYKLYLFSKIIGEHNAFYGRCLNKLSVKMGFISELEYDDYESDDQEDDLIYKYIDLFKHNKSLEAKLNEANDHIKHLQSLPGGEIYEAAKEDFYRFSKFKIE